MPEIINYFWILFIIGTIVNGLGWKFKSKKYIKENSELEAGYRRLTNRWMIFGNIPWIIMGVGMISGHIDNIFDFLNPPKFNFIIIIFYMSIYILWIALLYWIFFRNGAEVLMKHPGLITKTEKGNEKFEIMKVKIFVIIGTIGLILQYYLMNKYN